MDFIGLIIFLVTLIVIFATFMVRAIIISNRDKKLMSELNIGDYVVTHSGICGKIMGIKEGKDIVFLLLQTGDDMHKNYITVDIESVADKIEGIGTILRDEIKVEEKPNNIKEL